MASQQFLPEILWLTMIFLAPHGKAMYLLTSSHASHAVVFMRIVCGGGKTNPRETTTAWEANSRTVPCLV